MALTEEGQLFTFGSSKDGKLGYDVMGNQYIPKKIPDLPKMQSREVTNDRNAKYHIFSQYDDAFTMYPTFNTIIKCQIVRVEVLHLF